MRVGLPGPPKSTIQRHVFSKGGAEKAMLSSAEGGTKSTFPA